jgi:hypothetical protein
MLCFQLHSAPFASGPKVGSLPSETSSESPKSILNFPEEANEVALLERENSLSVLVPIIISSNLVDHIFWFMVAR